MTPPTTRFGRWTVRIAAVYLALLLVVWLTIRESSDYRALPTLISFGPRWLVAIPLLVLVPLAVFSRRPAAGLLVTAAMLVAALPVLNGVVSRPASPPPTAVRLRVMTWNTQGHPIDKPPFREYLDIAKPDLLFLQEVTSDRKIPGWQLTAGRSGVKLASRMTARGGDDWQGSEWASRFTVETPFGELPVAGVHLPTPRPGIEVVLATKGRNLAALRDTIADREQAITAAGNWVRSATIIAGDFNTPDDSPVFRSAFASHESAFRSAGFGLGWTKRTSWHGVRIDHILFTPPWRCSAAWVGPDLGSDHRPLLAELCYAQE